MTIQEAIKSGKPFRRPNHGFWITIFQNRFYVYLEPSMQTGEQIIAEIHPTAVLATDWEVKPWPFHSS